LSIELRNEPRRGKSIFGSSRHRKAVDAETKFISSSPPLIITVHSTFNGRLKTIVLYPAKGIALVLYEKEKLFGALKENFIFLVLRVYCEAEDDEIVKKSLSN
jgi:hypothetical protein